MSEVTEAIATLAREMKRLGSVYDLPALSEAAVTFGERIECCTEELDEGHYIPALEGLRRARSFKELATLADLLWRLGYRTHKVLNFHCHALIELRQLAFAIGHLEWVAAQTEGNRKDPDFVEATGLLGRAYKQLFLDEKRQPRSVWAGWALQKAISTYSRGYDPESLADTSWHAVNVAALIKLAERESIPCPAGLDDARPFAQTLIDRLPRLMGMPQINSDLKLWIPGTVAGAHAALGNWEEAANWYGQYVQQQDIDAHKLYGSIRQLEDIWGAKPTVSASGVMDAQGRLLMSLKAKLANLAGGQVVFSGRDIRELLRVTTTNGMSHESVLGEEGPKRVAWLKNGLHCSQSVARILRRRRRTNHGTGFLVRGSDLSAALGDELYLLTNAHVISNPPEFDAVTAEEAVATFDADESKTSHDLELVWQSPVAELDAALLRIRPQPLFERLTLAPDDFIPEALRSEADMRDAYVIGHPGNDDLSISLHDTDLIDIGYKHASRKENIFIRYRTPTKPGNSGSPVFEHDNWWVIGLHHMGAPEKGGLRKLAGREGFTPAANEGIAMRSIRAAIAAHFGAPPST